MAEDIYSLYTIFRTKRDRSVRRRHYWVWCTCQSLQRWGDSECNPGDLRRSLRQKFGFDAVGSTSIPNLLNKTDRLMSVVVLVDGELWTDESVLWQNKLQDRAEYEVVYRTAPSYKPPTPQPVAHRQKQDKFV
jgi:hypothetical protein